MGTILGAETMLVLPGVKMLSYVALVHVVE